MVLPIAIGVIILAIVVLALRTRKGTNALESRADQAGYECSTCGEYFESPEALGTHARQH